MYVCIHALYMYIMYIYVLYIYIIHIYICLYILCIYIYIYLIFVVQHRGTPLQAAPSRAGALIWPLTTASSRACAFVWPPRNRLFKSMCPPRNCLFKSMRLHICLNRTRTRRIRRRTLLQRCCSSVAPLLHLCCSSLGGTRLCLRIASFRLPL